MSKANEIAARRRIVSLMDRLDAYREQWLNKQIQFEALADAVRRGDLAEAQRIVEEGDA